MNLKLKSCYVLLKRNFLNTGETISKINNCPMLEMENLVKSSKGNRIPDCEILSSVNNKENNKLRKKEKINYSEDIENDVCSEDTLSEFSNDGILLDDEEMSKEPKTTKLKHDLSKSSPKKLSCLLCHDKSFSTHFSYLKHKLSHESNPYKCILCSMRFHNRQSFLLHMKRYHPEVEPFICEYPLCEQNFKTRRLLEIHHKAHWKYMCKYCKKLFVRKHHMLKHILKIH